MPEKKPLYTCSMKEAIEHDELADWRESYKENCDCARAIEKAIREHYQDNVLEDCAEEILEQYGFDRVNWVLANTIRQNMEDGRFSHENKSWARKLYIPNDEVRWHFSVDSHPGLTDLFCNQVRKAWQKLGFFDHSHCVSEQDGEIDYKGKVLVLKPTVLKEECRMPDNQLFLATGGFGCAPDSHGRKVLGYFLNDREETHFYRADFIGVIREECLPNWARELAEETVDQAEEESQTPMMGGM